MGDNLEDQIQDFYTNIGQNPALAPVKEAINTIMDRVVLEGMTPKQAVNMSDETMEGFYTEGQRLYSSGKYDEAFKIFRFLAILDPTRVRYYLGMAACKHMDGKYFLAAQLYQMCSLADPTDPIPHFHMADCYIKLEMESAARHCLKQTVRWCGGQPKYCKVQDRAKMMLEELSPERTEAEQNEE